jgi:UDP-N-acetylmuramoyl-tripeptide--D-alanyl-D-alanine ligase
MSFAVASVCVFAALVASMRWLRVAQREHYIAGYTSRYAWKWWTAAPYNVIAGVAGLIGVIASVKAPVAAIVTAVVVLTAPFGLSLRGRTSKLNWTRRLKTVAAISGVLLVLWLAICAIGGLLASGAALAALLLPAIIDIALLDAAPFERRAAQKFVDAAKNRLSEVGCEVIAVTGSYGKTTTKGYVRTLVNNTIGNAVASPASFNNTAGLSRAINESLPDGTKFFIAEMDTYKPGEITQLCKWLQPSVATIAAVGPVHLDRFSDEEKILPALAEVFLTTKTAVIRHDTREFQNLAVLLEQVGQKVIRVNGPNSDVNVSEEGDQLMISIGDVPLEKIPRLQHSATNVACAVGVALAVGAKADKLKSALHDLQVPEHRKTVGTGRTGATIIDNTFNSNPASARASLEVLQRNKRPDKYAIVISPGMIELGKKQSAENEAFARAASQIATHFFAIGLTNRESLARGTKDGLATYKWFSHREDAVAWVREHVGEGDVVLYENDFPDHIP